MTDSDDTDANAHAELVGHEHRKGPTMDTAIKRLRASKTRSAKDAMARGKECGRTWAAEAAEFDELLRLSATDTHCLATLIKAVNPHGAMSYGEVLEYIFRGDAGHMMDERFTVGFIDGAREFFSEVKDKL